MGSADNWMLGDTAALDDYVQPPDYNKPWSPPTAGMAPWPYQQPSQAQSEAEMAQQAREAAAYRGRQGYETAATRPQESNRLNTVAGAVGGIPSALGSLAAIPGQTMAPNPHQPGTEEWQFFEDARKSNTYQKAPELAFNMMGGGATFAQPGAAGIFGGKLSKTADISRYNTAEEMLQYGKNANEIRKETGWFPGAAGILKYEIPDKGTGWVKGQEPSKLLKSDLPARATTGRTYIHPELYEAYPDIANSPLTIMKMEHGTRGGYAPPTMESQTGRIYIAPGSASGMRNVFLHEAQHAVQGVEGWPIGGNPQTAIAPGTPGWEIYQRKLAEVLTPMSREDFFAMAKETGLHAPANAYEKYLEEFKDFKPSKGVDDSIRRIAAFEAYHKTVGEVEARNVQARKDFGPRQRESIPPHVSQDVPYSEQNLVWDNRLKHVPMGAFAEPLQLSAKAPTGFAPGGAFEAKAPSIVRAKSEPTAADIAAIKEAAVGYGRKGWPTTNYEVFKTTPEAYAETTKLVPQVSIKQHLPGQPWETAPKDLPNKGRSGLIIKNTEEIANRIAERLGPWVEKGDPRLKFYHTGPVIRGLEQYGGLSVPEGNTFMRNWAGQGAATSPRTQTPPNLRNSSYLLHERARGNPLTPERYAEEGNIPGFPMMGMHVNLAEDFATRGEKPWVNPKPTTFRENWSGNLMDVTGDTHNIRSTLYEMDQVKPGSLPRGWFSSDKAYAQYRKEGFLSLDPGDFVDTLGTKAINKISRQTEYLPMTEPWYRAADKLGIYPAEAQSGGWFSYGPITKLQSPPKTIVNLLNDQVSATARAMNTTPERIVELWSQGKIPLAGLAGAGALAPAVMGEIAGRDKYQ